jgi:hypothetical protein
MVDGSFYINKNLFINVYIIDVYIIDVYIIDVYIIDTLLTISRYLNMNLLSKNFFGLKYGSVWI